MIGTDMVWTENKKYKTKRKTTWELDQEFWERCDELQRAKNFAYDKERRRARRFQHAVAKTALCLTKGRYHKKNPAPLSQASQENRKRQDPKGGRMIGNSDKFLAVVIALIAFYFMLTLIPAFARGQEVHVDATRHPGGTS
jgi:hypothetical protein